MNEIINPYVLNIITTSIKGLSDMDEIQYPSEDIRFAAIKTMVQDFLQQLQQIRITPAIEALQINQTQVLSFFYQTAKIISVEQANQSDKRYLSLKNLKQTFNLDLDIREFNLNK